ncbi:MAG: hypothetical protein SGI89_13800 [bacterium]|nr:hypothetical protein [bacterium]
MNKNYKIFFFSFLFALTLWLYIELNLSYSLDISIPVEVQSSKSQALAEEIPNSIDVKVNGKGWDLLNILISKNLKYNLDITKLKKDSKIITQQYISERLNLKPNVSILEITPDTISINFDKVTSKNVPVKNNIIVNLKEGYRIIGNPSLDPNLIDVEGASFLISKIKYLPTETKVFNNVNTDIEGFINLKDTLSNLINVGTKVIKFSYRVQLSAEKDLEEVNIDVMNVPDDKEVLLIPPKLRISLRGGVDQLAQINSSEVKASIEFGKIESDTLGFIVPELQLPEEVTILKIEPPKLQYIIKNKLQ